MGGVLASNGRDTHQWSHQREICVKVQEVEITFYNEGHRWHQNSYEEGLCKTRVWQSAEDHLNSYLVAKQVDAKDIIASLRQKTKKNKKVREEKMMLCIFWTIFLTNYNFV